MRDAKSRWAQLDTAAKIFPCTSGRRDTKVFRFVCELTQPVQPQLLQQALEDTLASFPGFRMVLKRGLFWYYLEGSDIVPVVRREYRTPCSQLYDRDVTGLLFEVTWYGSRINLEVYHAISDGTGAMHFLRLLVFRYLRLAHPEELGGLPELDYDASEAQSMDDGFEHYANQDRFPKHRRRRKAYRLRGTRTSDFALSVVVGTAPVRELLRLSHAHNTSLTVLLCALVIRAIGGQIPARERGKPVTLAVPINLRNHFHSASARNFFGVMDVVYDFSKGGGALEDIICSVQKQFDVGLTPAEMQYRVNQYIALIRNPISRGAPLPLKDMAMRAGYRMNSKLETSAVSNVGIVKMPPQLSPYLRQFEAFVSTEKVQLCILTYGERITMSFSSAFVDMEVQKDFFRSLTALGVPIQIDTDFV